MNRPDRARPGIRPVGYSDLAPSALLVGLGAPESDRQPVAGDRAATVAATNRAMTDGLGAWNRVIQGGRA